MWKDFFFFPSSDKRAILILSALLLVGLIILWLKPASPTEEMNREIADSLYQAATRPQYPKPNSSPKEYRPFNPNTADSITMVKAGVPRFVAGNIVRYREAGGRFRNPQQLARIYGMTEDTYIKLLPYIHIPVENIDRKERIKRPADSTGQAIPKRLSSIKYPSGTTIDLNTADTTELKKIPGIGSWRAKRIVEYRQRLGGFYNLAQLKEIDGLPEGIAQWFVLKSPVQAQLNINKEGIGGLQKHPYINFYQARCIVEYRRKHGPLVDLNQLLLCEEFTIDDLKKLKPYIIF